MEKKRVAILTCYAGNRNYGGLLQAYALQRVIEERAESCIVLQYKANRKKYIWNRMRSLGLKKTFYILKIKVKSKIHMQSREYREGIEKRNAKFEIFEKMIPHSRAYNDETISESVRESDIFVCGSDQIWNPALWNENYFLDYVPDGKKKFSYAASVGKVDLTRKEMEYLRAHLASLDEISVREETLQKLICEEIKMPAALVLDPTLLLTECEWRKIMRKPDGCPSKYIFLFSLGDNEERKKQIYGYCRRQGISVVAIPHLQAGYKKEDERYSDVRLYDIGPQEWIYLIANAECVFTDSFHGTAFCINFKKEFYCFERNGDNIGIERQLGLLKLLHIENRVCGEKIERSGIDYSVAERILSEMRSHSIDFLEHALFGAREKGK